MQSIVHEHIISHLLYVVRFTGLFLLPIFVCLFVLHHVYFYNSMQHFYSNKGLSFEKKKQRQYAYNNAQWLEFW